MKIKRSSKTTLKFLTIKKRKILDGIMDEYSRVAGLFIDYFWEHPEIHNNSQLTVEIYSLVETWFTARMAQCAAREAFGMVNGANQKAKQGNTEPVKPNHSGRKMILSSQVIKIEEGNNSFDLWLILSSVGNKIKLYIPLKKHRHFNFFSDFKMANSVVVHRNYVQFSFEKEIGSKKTSGSLTGIDVGINNLLATSNGDLFGSDIKQLINTIKRKQQNSKAYVRAKKTLSYYLHKTVKDQIDWNNSRLVVVEKLHQLKYGKEGRSRGFRKTLSNWNYRELLNIIQMRSEENRVVFRSVNPYKTSQTCPVCAHAERGNRVNEKFRCLKCGYSGHADIIGASNILTRFTTGRYGAGFQTV